MQLAIFKNMIIFFTSFYFMDKLNKSSSYFIFNCIKYIFVSLILSLTMYFFKAHFPYISYFVPVACFTAFVHLHFLPCLQKYLLQVLYTTSPAVVYIDIIAEYFTNICNIFYLIFQSYALCYINFLYAITHSAFLMYLLKQILMIKYINKLKVISITQ